METGLENTMEQLNRANAQITDIEQEIYESLDLDRLRSHKSSGLSSFIFSSNTSVENYIIVKQAAETNANVAPSANQLRQLLGARACIQEAIMQASEPNEFNNYLENDFNNAKFARDEFMNAYDGDVNDISGDAKIFKE